MKLTVGYALLAYAGCSIVLLAAGLEKTSRDDKHRLPADPEAAVITLDFSGSPMAQKKTEPALTIRADGKVIVNSPFGPPKRFESRVTQKELQNLLRFIIDRNKFFRFDERQVQRAVGGPVADDAPTTVIRIHAGGRVHEAKFNALDDAAALHPEIQPLQQLLAISQRLVKLIGVICAGGKVRVAKAVKWANAHLKRKFPKAPLLTAEDLELAHPTADGGTRLRFLRKQLGRKGTVLSYVLVEIDRPVRGRPRLTVTAKLQ